MLTNQETAWVKQRQSNFLFKQLLEKEFSRAGLPELTSFEALLVINNDSLRAKDLLDKVDVTKSGLSRLLCRLEDNALIKSRECAEDKRCTYFELTSKGKETLEQGLTIWRAIVADVFPVSEKEADELIKLNNTIHTKLLTHLNEPDCEV